MCVCVHLYICAFVYLHAWIRVAVWTYLFKYSMRLRTCHWILILLLIIIIIIIIYIYKVYVDRVKGRFLLRSPRACLWLQISTRRGSLPGRDGRETSSRRRSGSNLRLHNRKTVSELSRRWSIFLRYPRFCSWIHRGQGISFSSFLFLLLHSCSALISHNLYCDYKMKLHHSWCHWICIAVMFLRNNKFIVLILL